LLSFNFVKIDFQKFTFNIFNTMKIKSLIIFSILLTSTVAMSQQATDKTVFYTRLEGVIGTNIHVTANIIRLFDELSGNYQYRFINEDTKMHFGKTICLNGEVTNENAKLKEMGQNSDAFIGTFNKKSFTGTWNTPDNRQVDFNFKEYYPNGTLPFEIYYLHSEDKLVAKDLKSPTAEIELTLIFPKDNYFQAGIVDSVKQLIANSFFGNDFYENNPDSMLTHFENEYFSNYKKQNEDWYGKGASFSWQKTINMSVIFNSNYLLCFEYLKYAYSGGAHGMTNVAYDIINLNNSSILTYNDIFEEGTDDSLSNILTQMLRKDYSIPYSIPLKEAGFFVDSIVPNHNIYINGSGIGFLYNSYEIAPYSNGQTNIFLEFDKIKQLLKKGTPVSMMRDR